MKLHTTQKLQRYKGRLVCWATHPEQRNSTANARSRVMHLGRIGPKFNFPATICGMAVVTYAVVDQGYDCATYDGRQLCKPCLGQLESDRIETHKDPNPRWAGKTAVQWALEHERLTTDCKEYDLKCRELSIDLGASREEARELHRQLERINQRPPSFFKKAALYLLGGK